ncbi:MAG: HAD-IA family hydrolase [Opitutales bacterium]|nr:HAD-IA family hydrolase [Opitutales bacterium]MCH8539777.1 HAD family hydrolase [Opitutales bacterium]
MNILLLDAANTIIEKKGLWNAYLSVLSDHHLKVDANTLRRNHKIISEMISFPDRTDKAFYDHFNSNLLYSVGIIPNDHLLDEIFHACRSLPWEPCPDAHWLNHLTLDIAVLSNFHHGLEKILGDLFPGVFSNIIDSEKERVRKPEGRFFQRAMEILSFEPSEVIYVGDSLKLDIAPALKAGFNAWLVDRDDDYPCFSRKIRSLKEISDILLDQNRPLSASSHGNPRQSGEGLV